MVYSILGLCVIKRTFVASLLLLPCVLAADANTVFAIAPGNKYDSGCDKYKNDLPGYIQEAFDMAKSGLDVFNTLQDKSGAYSDMSLFTMLFGINMIDYKYSDKLTMDARLESLPRIQSVLEQIDSDYVKSLGAKIYCGGRAFVWTEKAFDKDTGKVTDKPLRDEIDLPDGVTGAYWFPPEKTYVKLPNGSSKINICEFGEAFTLVPERVIVICPKKVFLFKKSLRPFKDGTMKINQGDLMDSFASVPGTLLHEMSHLVDGKVTDQNMFDTDLNSVPNKKTYNYQPCVNLANALLQDKVDGDATSLNSDTYRVWSQGCYLNSVDWASGKAVQRVQKKLRSLSV